MSAEWWDDELVLTDGERENANVIHERGALAYTLIWTTEPSIYIHKLSHIPNPLINQISAANFFLLLFTLLSFLMIQSRISCVYVDISLSIPNNFSISVDQMARTMTVIWSERRLFQTSRVLFNFWPRRFKLCFLHWNDSNVCLAHKLEIVVALTEWASTQMRIIWFEREASRELRSWNHKFQISSFFFCVLCFVGIWMNCEIQNLYDLGSKS